MYLAFVFCSCEVKIEQGKRCDPQSMKNLPGLSRESFKFVGHDFCTAAHLELDLVVLEIVGIDGSGQESSSLMDNDPKMKQCLSAPSKAICLGKHRSYMEMVYKVDKAARCSLITCNVYSAEFIDFGLVHANYKNIVPIISDILDF